MGDCYFVERDSSTGLYFVKVNGVEVADGLELGEAVALLESLMQQPSE